MKPIKTLFFTLAVFGLLASAIWITPEEGIVFGDFKFQLPAFDEMLLKKEVIDTDVSQLLEQQFDIDSLLAVDTLFTENDTVKEEIRKASYDSLVQAIYKIEFAESGRENINLFFEKLAEKIPTRIMHYGDSQIEVDRITSFLREKLQIKFGGSGPGLRSVIQPFDNRFSAIQVISDNWQRYQIYGKIDTNVVHSKYGVLASFVRFAPPFINTPSETEPVRYESEMSFSKSGISYKRTRVYKRLRIFYGNSSADVTIKIFIKDQLFAEDKIKKDVDYGVLSYDLPDSTDQVSMKFAGTDSPDIYGVELADPDGIIVDNIPLRGSSGTFFTKLDFSHSQKMYEDLNPGLILLQFGGNVVPAIKNEKTVTNYGRWFASQIYNIKKMCPNASIVVIGPSDMSTKNKDNFITYEYLPDVVNVLKETALSQGCGYWDMYEAMGGKNSMPAWVNAEPELARPDYTHFSPRGAKLIANMFYNALVFEYNNYLNEKK